MQSTSNLSNLSFSEDIKRRLQYRGIKLRAGQEEFIDYVDSHPKQTVYNGVMPTGYGKSKTAECTCEILKKQGRANRFLFIVPTDTQRTQYITGIGEDFINMGLDLRLAEYQTESGLKYHAPMLVDCSTKVLRAHRENLCEVYVTTVQSITCNEGFYADLMSSGRWCIFCDEYQKLNKDESAKWGKAVQNLNYCVMFGLTATPIRSDKKDTVFASKEPDVMVTLEEAYEQKAIRGVQAHIEHYFVDVKSNNGEIERVTTENINSYDLSKELRFTTKYMASILASATACLSVKNLAHEKQHQMLVFAMNVSHAKNVSDLLNELYGDGFSQWVGVGPDGRPDKENKDIIQRYKNNKLPCLVQVDLAGEGFDNPRSSVLVFLHLLKKATVKAVQQAGRGLRRNYLVAEFDQDICDIFASPDTEMAELAVELANRTLDSMKIGEEKGGTGGRNKRNTPIYEIPPFDSSIQNTEYDRSVVISKITQFQIDSFRDRVAKVEGDDVAKTVSDDRLRQILADSLMEKTEKIKALNDTKKSSELKVQEAQRTLMNNVARFRYGYSVPKTVYGDIMRAINTRWVKQTGLKHSSMLDEDFAKKHEWLKSINDGIQSTREIPAWLQL